MAASQENPRFGIPAKSSRAKTMIRPESLMPPARLIVETQARHRQDAGKTAISRRKPQVNPAPQPPANKKNGRACARPGPTGRYETARSKSITASQSDIGCRAVSGNSPGSAGSAMPLCSPCMAGADACQSCRRLRYSMISSSTKSRNAATRLECLSSSGYARKTGTSPLSTSGSTRTRCAKSSVM